MKKVYITIAILTILDFQSASIAMPSREDVVRRTRAEIADLAIEYCQKLNDQDGFTFKDYNFHDFNGYHRQLLNACELGINLQLAFGGSSPTVEILNQCDKMYDPSTTGASAQLSAVQRERCRDGISRAIILSEDGNG
jgi:hypothetical protein